jgi:hypothetical protein
LRRRCPPSRYAQRSSARGSERFTNPSNPRESEDAPVSVVQQSWAEIRALAVDLGIAERDASKNPPFDPDAYAASIATSCADATR